MSGSSSFSAHFNASSSSSSSSSSSENGDGINKGEDDDNNNVTKVSVGNTEFFAVHPLPWCPHLQSSVQNMASEVDIFSPCEGCGDRNENWVCLTCYKVFCSRYVQRHMAEHAAKKKHPVVLSFSDLSVWCFECDSYVDNEICRPALSYFRMRKFGDNL